MGSEVASPKPHVVLTPFPAQGHLNSFLKLAKLLHSRGFHVTFVNTEFNHARQIKSMGPHALGGLPDFRFEAISDGLPPPPSDAIDATQDVLSLCVSTAKYCLPHFRKLLARLAESASDGVVPPVTSLVSDGVMTFTVEAAKEFGVPIALYWPASTVSFLGILHYRTLLDKGVIPFKDESYLTNGLLDTKVDWLPGMSNNITLKDLPTFLRITDPNDSLFNFFLNELQRAKTAEAILFNTFNDLDCDALNTLSSVFRPLFPIGPLSLLFSHTPISQDLDSICTNLWKEDTQCLQWLQPHEPRSVVYVNFGSITVMSAEQLYEFAWGLANSQKPFLWVIRPDLVDGGSVVLSPEFLSEIKDRGFIASWCAQEKVLNHPSIGGFLTHCGWNSMTESLSAGVPMACWPFFADQQTNCWYACNEWGIGIEIDNNVRREEVERVVNELMQGEKGKKMREKVLMWKKIAEKETSPGGSSYINFEKLIKAVLNKNKN